MSRILVVDDDRELRDNIVEILTDAGYEIQSSDNAESALEVLDSKEFDLIIMDLIMPGMGGLAVLPLARQKCPNARIIVITAFSTVDNAV
ncbi:MAG: response regulator, partial [bacterium]